MVQSRIFLQYLILGFLVLHFTTNCYSQLNQEDYINGIKNGFNQYKIKWAMNDAVITESSQATVQYFNKYLNDTLTDVSFFSSGSIYFHKFQGFTVYALDSISEQLEAKLKDSPLVDYIVLEKDEYTSSEVLADSVYIKLNNLMQLFQEGWPTYLPPKIANGYKTYFNRAENWGSVIFDKIVSNPTVLCYDINGKKIRLRNLQKVSATQLNFSFPSLKKGVYILAPKAKNSKFEPIKFNW